MLWFRALNYVLVKWILGLSRRDLWLWLLSNDMNYKLISLELQQIRELYLFSLKAAKKVHNEKRIFRKYLGKIVYKSYLVTNKCHVLGRNTTQQNKHPENREKKHIEQLPWMYPQPRIWQSKLSHILEFLLTADCCTSLISTNFEEKCLQQYVEMSVVVWRNVCGSTCVFIFSIRYLIS